MFRCRETAFASRRWNGSAYEKDGKTVKNEIPVICSNLYKGGKKVKVAVNDFAAEAETDKYGRKNPLAEFSGTERLVSNDILIRDAAIKGLEAEAAENEGHLHVNTDTCYKYRAYDGTEEI